MAKNKKHIEDEIQECMKGIWQGIMARDDADQVRKAVAAYTALEDRLENLILVSEQEIEAVMEDLEVSLGDIDKTGEKVDEILNIVKSRNRRAR